MSPHPMEESAPTTAKIPYDILAFGIVMIISGLFDIYIIVANPEYRLTVLGWKLEGPILRYFIFLFPIFHFVVGYGMIKCRRWTYYLFFAFAIYGIVSPAINYFRFPPPHRVRTILLIGSFIVLAYLRWRRPYFKT